MDPEDEINELAEEKSLLRYTLKLLREEWVRKCENDEDQATIFLIDAILLRTRDKDFSPEMVRTYNKSKVDLSEELKVLSPEDTPLLSSANKRLSDE